VSYRKDQGRYARMFAFWALVLLVAYGCFHGGGLAELLSGWLGASNQEFVKPFPIIDKLDTAALLALAVLVAIAFVIHRVLNRPHIADTLIDTEREMHQVTWPTWREAWQGTVAVTVMVVILFLFLSLADMGIIQALLLLTGGA
jgi:preprotein translocase SecE subunit